MMYQQKRITLKQLWRTRKTKQTSIHALRERGREGLLSFIGTVGTTQFFNEQLSIIRENAGYQCRRPGVTWTGIAHAIKALDKRDPDLDTEIIRLLNEGKSMRKAIQFVFEKLREEIGF